MPAPDGHAELCTASDSQHRRRAVPPNNTSERDMDTIAERCRARLLPKRRARAARARPRRRPRSVSSTGSRRASSYKLGRDDLDGVRVLVQGLGAVGGAARAATWREAGADVLVSDVNADARRRVGLRHAVDPNDVIGTECDVYAPCAIGGDDRRRDRRTSCAAGSSPARPTTSSRSPRLADRLHERGILYAPDYVINSGGVLHGTGLELLGWDQRAPRPGAAGPRRHAHRALRGQRPLAGRTPPSALSSARRAGGTRS